MKRYVVAQTLAWAALIASWPVDGVAGVALAVVGIALTWYSLSPFLRSKKKGGWR
jgi:hypothetical protein